MKSEFMTHSKKNWLFFCRRFPLRLRTIINKEITRAKKNHTNKDKSKQKLCHQRE